MIDPTKEEAIDNLFADLRDAKDDGNANAAAIYVSAHAFWKEVKRLPPSTYTNDLACRFFDTLILAAVCTKQTEDETP